VRHFAALRLRDGRPFDLASRSSHESRPILSTDKNSVSHGVVVGTSHRSLPCARFRRDPGPADIAKPAHEQSAALAQERTRVAGASGHQRENRRLTLIRGTRRR
jgi:hypothetical protein